MFLPRRGPSALKLGLISKRGELVGVGHVANDLDVQLAEDQVLEAAIASCSSPVATTTISPSGWRILTLAWARAARASSTACAGGGHVGFELGVGQRGVGCREVGQVDRLGAVGPASFV